MIENSFCYKLGFYGILIVLIPLWVPVNIAIAIYEECIKTED